MRLMASLGAIVLWLLLASSAWADIYVPICPPSIEVMQALVKVPEGWSGFDSVQGQSDHKTNTHTLINVQFSDGNPREQALLTPSAEKKRGRFVTYTWNFSPAMSDGHWISCEYSRTTVAVTQKLPDKVKSCSATFDARFSTPVAQRVECN